ncbi:MAG: hypothetical protein BWY86_00719 [Candidatus Aminicenantes bacterium ADurb.Bin508]|nr:MAG: hypothetical protein BWY86_00719 [Candidatus Aminicenantes bacterium ADurb.Bin508]
MGEEFENRLIGPVDVLRIPGQGGPAERPLPFAEEGADVEGDEAFHFEGVGDPVLQGLAADVVAVVEGDGPGLLKLHHSLHVPSHGVVGTADVLLGVLFPEPQGFGVAHPARDIAVELIMGRGLIGNDFGDDPSAQKLGKDLRSVPQQTDGESPSLPLGLFGHAEGLVQTLRGGVQVGGVKTFLDPFRIDFHNDGDPFVHGNRQGLGPSHSPEPRRQRESSLEGPPVVLLTHGGEGFVGPLKNPLRTDVDPGTGGHLTVHGQAEGFQTTELIPLGPLGNEEGVGDQDPRGVGMGLKDSHRFAGLDKEGFIVLQLPQRFDDLMVRLPVSGGLSCSSVDNQLLRLFRDLGIKVVHEHPQGRLGEPATATEFLPSRGFDGDGFHPIPPLFH